MSSLASIVILCTDPYVAGPFWSVVRWEAEQPHRWTVLEAPDGVLFCAIHPAA